MTTFTQVQYSNIVENTGKIRVLNHLAVDNNVDNVDNCDKMPDLLMKFMRMFGFIRRIFSLLCA